MSKALSITTNPNPYAVFKKNKEPCTLSKVLLITSLAIAIIVGVIVGLAAYFFSSKMMPWMGIVGGAGSALIFGSITYMILQCIHSKIPQKCISGNQEFSQKRDDLTTRPTCSPTTDEVLLDPTNNLNTASPATDPQETSTTPDSVATETTDNDSETRVSYSPTTSEILLDPTNNLNTASPVTELQETSTTSDSTATDATDNDSERKFTCFSTTCEEFSKSIGNLESLLSSPESILTTSSSIVTDSKNGEVVIDATVYAYSTAFPIAGDYRFRFAKRMKFADQTPLTVEENDLCIVLGATFATQDAQERLKVLCDDDRYIHLPLALLNGVKEGEIVQFFYNDVFFTLCCRQAEHFDENMREATFQKALEEVVDYSSYWQTQNPFRKERSREPTFMGCLIGRSLVQIDPSNGAKTPCNDLAFYETDQENYGGYREIPFRVQRSDWCAWNTEQVPLEEIHFIESKGLNNLRQLWIVIPHRIEENQFPKGYAKMDITVGRQSVGRINRKQFDLKKHRVPMYRYGRYCMVSLDSDSEFKIQYIRDHKKDVEWLHLTLYKPS